MGNEFWIVYDLASGEERWRGGGPAGSAVLQQLPEGLGLVVVPATAIVGGGVDLAIVRASLALRVDAEAEQVRLRFITAGAGQGMTYLRKEAEARAWTADDTAQTPFLDAEAATTGMTVAEVAADVIANADAWVPIGSAIEGLRRGAKVAMDQATTLGGIVAAAGVDWSVFGG